MATNIGDLFVRVGADTDGLNRGLRDATRATRRMARTSGQNLRRISVEAQRAVPPVGRLTGALGALSGALSAREVVRYADSWQNAANQLRQVTNSTNELESAQNALMRVANETRSDFASTASLYSRLSRSTTELGLDTQDLIGLTRTINQSFAVSGASAEEASAAITQLSQGLAAGALRGDEFNSVAEQAPALMRAIAESLDMTIGELREFAAEGKITAEIVVDALQQASGTIEQNFGRAVATFGQQMTVARNNMREFVGTSDQVESALSGAGETIVTLSENLDQVVNAAQVAAGLFAGRLAGSMAASASGMTAASAAATGLRTSLAFLGGPIGILVGAGGLLFAFRDELGLVRDQAGLSADEIDRLTDEAEGLSAAARENKIGDLSRALEEATLKAAAAREQLAQLRSENQGTGFLGMGAGELGEEIRGMQAVADAQERILEINQRLSAAQGARKFGPLSDFLLQAPGGGGGDEGEDDGGGGGTGQTPQQQEQERKRLREHLQQRLEIIRESLMSEGELQTNQFLTRAERLAEAREQELIGEQEHKLMLRELAQQHHEKMNEMEARASEDRKRIQEKEAQARRAVVDGMMSNLVTLMDSGSKSMFQIGKAAAIAQALLSGREAIVNSYNAGTRIGGPPLGAAFAATAAAATAAQIASVKSTTFGGGGSTGGSTGGGGTSAMSAGPQNPQQQQQQRENTIVTVNLREEARYSGREVRNLIESINDELDNGMRLRIR